MVFPEIVGVVNITHDSFSDGGRYLSPDQAIAHALALHAQGADIIDLGAAASNPQSERVATVDEIARLQPVIAALQARDIPISVDSFNPEVQRFAIEAGVNFINDVSGFNHLDIYPILAQSNCRLVVMHNMHVSAVAEKIPYDVNTVLAHLQQFFTTRIDALVTAGVARSRLIVDPGMGWFLSDNPQVSIAVLRQLNQLTTELNLPVFLGVSRKSFLRKLTGKSADQVAGATLAAELWAVAQGVAFIRTHEPALLRNALDFYRASGNGA